MNGTGIWQPVRAVRVGGRAVISIFSLLHFAAAAHAGANLFFTPVADPPTTPFTLDTGLNSPPYDWVSYILGVSTDDGQKIQAAEVKLKGMFHQRWNWDVDALNYAPTPVNASTTTGDTHLLAPANALYGLNPVEDNNVFSSPSSLPDVFESRDYGVGSSLKAAWAVQTAVSSMNLAYIVIPRGSESQLEYSIQGANPNGNILFDLRQGASFPPGPPLPPPTPPPPLPPPTPPTPPPPPPVHNPSGLFGTATLVKSPMMGNPFGAPDSALGAEWVSYLITVYAQQGTTIGAVEAQITGPLHQRWNDSDGDGISELSANGTTASALANGDSHLLAPAGSLFGVGPTEDNSGTGSPLPDTATADYGVGSFLYGAWALTQPATATNVAYIVIPKGSEHLLKFSIKAASPTGTALGTITGPFSYVPEPSSLLLVGLVLMTCVSRRRVQ